EEQRAAEGKRAGRDGDTRRSDDEVDMDKVTAAMVLTSLSTSPLVKSPPAKVNGEC
ncbi:unnamed protein product, partial [Tetraodon nigroviridis]